MGATAWSGFIERSLALATSCKMTKRNVSDEWTISVKQIFASELKDPICHSDECQIGSFSSEATKCTSLKIHYSIIYHITLNSAPNSNKLGLYLDAPWKVSTRFNQIAGTSLVEMDISTNEAPAMWINPSENSAPYFNIVKTRTFAGAVWFHCAWLYLVEAHRTIVGACWKNAFAISK